MGLCLFESFKKQITWLFKIDFFVDICLTQYIVWFLTIHLRSSFDWSIDLSIINTIRLQFLFNRDQDADLQNNWIRLPADFNRRASNSESYSLSLPKPAVSEWTLLRWHLTCCKMSCKRTTLCSKWHFLSSSFH